MQDGSAAAIVARWFGLRAADVRAGLAAPAGVGVPPGLTLDAGRIVIITGPSGSGKSTLLNALRRAHRGRWLNLARMKLADRPVAEVMAMEYRARHAGAAKADKVTSASACDTASEIVGETEIAAGLEALSRVGLGEVWTYLRRPAELSDGQRWRLRLAIATARLGRMAASAEGGAGVGGSTGQRVAAVNDLPAKSAARVGPAVLSADEFGAVLDRVTACVVARSLRRIISATGAAAVVATSHEDLAEALSPDVVVRCDFGRVGVTRGKPS